MMDLKTEYKLVALTEEDAAYIGEGIDAIVPHETDTDEEEFVLRVEDEAGEIIGGCVIEAYEYRWRRMYLDTLWVDERYRHHGIGSMILREIERIAKEKGCRVLFRNAAAPVRPGLQAAAEPAQTERPVRLLQVPNSGYYSTLSFVIRETSTGRLFSTVSPLISF